MNNWEQHKLRFVADVKLSNVDKLTNENERIVRLCNYTDVYKNSFINFEKYEDFMIASCNENEYEKFILRKGQVAITKDSETPNDIGVSTYISEDFEDVVLGYHLALITPNTDKLNGRFLHYWLNTKQAKRYFENNAGGSGQRCTLVLECIKSTPLYLPNLSIQEKITKVLSDLDTKIELNNRINRELEAMAKTLYDYWFVQFDFPCLPADYRPSGQVNPNSELAQKIKAFSTYTKVGGLPLPDGKQWFVYILLCEDGSFYKGITNDLYRRFYEHYTGQGAKWTQSQRPQKIIHWEAYATQTEARKREEELKTGFGRTWIKREYEKLEKYGIITQDGLPAHQTRLMPAGKMVYNDELKREIPEGWEVKNIDEYAVVKKGELITAKDKKEGTVKVVAAGIDYSYLHSTPNQPKNTITISGSGANAGFINFWREPIFASDCITVRGKSDTETLILLQYLQFIQPHILNQATGSAQPHVYPNDIKILNYVVPPKFLTQKFGKIIIPINEKIGNNLFQNQHLSELRDWLLPMLMNGQVVVSPSVTTKDLSNP